MKIKQNCWEYNNCGRMTGGHMVAEMGICPAAEITEADGFNEGKNGGRICWAVSGTFCRGEKQGSYAMKKESCLECDFFKCVKKEELAEKGDFIMLLSGKKYSGSR